MEITAQQLAAMVGGAVEGNADAIINNYAKIEEASEGCLTFLANPKYTPFIYQTKASVVLVRQDFVPEQPISATLIRVADPYATLAQLLNMVSAQAPEKVGIEQPSYVAEGVAIPEDAYIGAFAYVGRGVKLGKGVKIYPHAFVGDGAVLGDNVTLYSGVKVYHQCVIGNRCIVHAGTVIGGDGFGFAPQPDGSYAKIAQIGNVVLEDDVEIGANSTIDRATMGSTIIRRGVKLDNLIQVAHNVEIGENTVIAAQAGIAGSTKLGKHCMVGGQVGFAGHITVGDNVSIGAQSGIPNSVGSDKRLMGYPAVNAIDFARNQVYIKRIPGLLKEVADLKALLSKQEK